MNKPSKPTKWERKATFGNFANIMENIVLSLDRADKYIGGAEQVRKCITVVDEATESVRVALGVDPVVFEYKSPQDEPHA